GRGHDARPVERVGLLGRQWEANGGPGVVGRRRGPVAEAQLALGASGRDVAPLEGISGLFGPDDPYAFGLVLGGLLVLGTVPRHGSSFQSPRSSCSLCSKAVSMAATCAAVSLSSSFSTRSSSSAESSPSFSMPSRSWRAARRTFRSATRPSSAMCLTIFTYSLRRSAVSGGNDRRMTLPSLLGLSPRSECWMAFSMALIDPAS